MEKQIGGLSNTLKSNGNGGSLSPAIQGAEATREMRNGLILAFLVLQLALPASYYLAGDTLDERFAWRMFSPVRTVSCQVTLYDDSSGTPRRLQLLRETHVAWKRLLERGRRHILQGFARHWCAQVPGRRLTADVECRTPDAMALGICRTTGRSLDEAGRRASFRAAPACAGRDPDVCYREECGDRDVATCYRARCRMRPIPRDLELCAWAQGAEG